MIRSKKSMTFVTVIIFIIIGLIVAYVVGYEIVWKRVGGGASDATKSYTGCNTNLRKCACLFTDRSCPSDATIPFMTKLTDECPPDNLRCDSDNFVGLLKQAKKDGKKGTCCVLDPKKTISQSRLNQPEAHGSASDQGGQTSSDVDCSKISKCSDYVNYPGYTSRMCLDDPCRDRRGVTSDLICFPSSESTCVECEKDCKMDFYDKFGTNAANLKNENPCNCISAADLKKQAELACMGKSEGDECGEPGSGERCGFEDGVLSCMPGCNYMGSVPGSGAFGYECLNECGCDPDFSPMTGSGFECKSSFFEVPQTCCVRSPPPDCCGISKCKHYSMDYPDDPDYCVADACNVGDCIPTFYPDSVQPAFAGKYKVCLSCSELEKQVTKCSDYNDIKDLSLREIVCIENPCKATAGDCVPYYMSGKFSECGDCPSSCKMSDYVNDELRERNPCGCT